MNVRRYFYIISLLFTPVAFAQYIQVNDNYTAQQLVDALVGGTCAQVSNVSINGWSGSSGSVSYGYFTKGTSNFPFDNGIILSTGFASSAPGPNNSLLSEGSTAWGGDNDLEDALNVNNTINATVLEFDFIPLTNHISFDYLFSSEQYLTSINSPNQCNYTDGFAFLLKEAGSSTYKNLAIVPGTNIPVRVNTVRGAGVCPEANAQYFGGFNGTNHPTNFNGQTVILKAESDVVAGTQYHIKLVVADQGNNLYDSAIFLGGGSFNATTDLGPDRLIAANNPLCNGEKLTLNAAYTGALGYQWFKDGVPQAAGAIPSEFEVNSPGVYTVEVQVNSTCFIKGRITVEYVAAPVASSQVLLQCDDDSDGLTRFNLSLATPLLTGGDPDFTVRYYRTVSDANTGTDAIINLINFQNITPNQQIFAVIENRYGCSAVGTVTLSTAVNGLSNPSPLLECDTDDDGFYNFDLTQKNAEILQGLPAGLQLEYYITREEALAGENAIPTPDNFTNNVAGSQTVYARIYNAGDCYGIAELELIADTFGSGFTNETVYLCTDSFIMLDAGNGFQDYEWDTTPVTYSQTLRVRQPGTYTASFKNSNACTASKTYIVLPSGPATNADFTINDFTSNNSITVVPEGPGSYVYSLDGINYQESPVFSGLNAGRYTVYIKDDNNCLPVYTDIVFVLDYPRYFSPNGDGKNDYWTIPYLRTRADAVVTIFDRFGKTITGFTGASAGWDGTLNGRTLPATDYWFVIELDNKTIKGHFSLLR
jgi:gliding motility-associated-like protein